MHISNNQWRSTGGKGNTYKKIGITNFGHFIILLFLHETKEKGQKLQTLWSKLLKFEAEGQEFAKILRSLEQFVRKSFGNRMFF